MDALVLTNNLAELRSRLAGRMSFGTAGLSSFQSSLMLFVYTGMRAAMESGFTRMNDLTIIQTTQGLAAYMKNVFKDKITGVVIGYDIRHNSERLVFYLFQNFYPSYLR
jgi:phosphomannomutase